MIGAALLRFQDPGRVSRCPLVIAATAHYAKFIDFVSEALPDKALRLNIPAGIRDVMNCSPLKRIVRVSISVSARVSLTALNVFSMSARA